MGDGEPYHVLIFLDVECHAAVAVGVCFLRRIRPGHDKTFGWGYLDHLADQFDGAIVIGADMFPAGPGLPVRHILMGPVAPCQVWSGNGFEHLLRRRLDIGNIDKADGFFGGHSWFPSSSVFRSCSALSRSSSNLRTQRS